MISLPGSRRPCADCGTARPGPPPAELPLSKLDAGALQADSSSFQLRLAAEGEAGKTIRTYPEAEQGPQLPHTERA
jgi:hypothetical protein